MLSIDIDTSAIKIVINALRKLLLSSDFALASAILASLLLAWLN